ncbi:hypothetical protein HY68_12555 [Streptomyces sp. AcH 505]|uniref:hypothetical protein n=1 Tax=Streptomyces sp. AcH 505 TaxID=352211 RepID=UPI000591FA30|nr:hypothetical protein HY68_12555 [Streptomyces sp. AcH 505]
MSEQTEPLHGRAADEIREQLRATTAGDPMRDYLAAIVEALDIPQPRAFNDRAHARLLESRARSVLTSLRGLLEDGKNADPGFDARWIRKSIAANPVTYEPYQDGGQS